MKFFGRQKEINKLLRIEQLSLSEAQFTVVTGRRRIGKTSLVKKTFADNPQMLYFFVARKAEADLCQIYLQEIKEKLGTPFPGGIVSSFAEVFRFVMESAISQHITIFIDEFQEFYKVNPSIFSDMQNIWDTYKDRAKVNLIVGGSVNTLINRIFMDKKEPLYGRHNAMINLKPFSPSILIEIMNTYNPGFLSEDFLAMYTITGGVPKYIDLLVQNKRFTEEEMLEFVFQEDSFFLSEGKTLLIEEFGKDYGTYFSILTLISEGKNTRAELDNALAGIPISGHLKNLIDDFGWVSKRQPLYEKSENKNVRYAITDQFLRFWFRFVYKYSHYIEAGGYIRLKQQAESNFSTFTGPSLEAYFIEVLKETGCYTRIGYWHDRKGENEIDIIAEDEIEHRVEFIEVKRKEKNLDMSILRAKADKCMTTLGKYKKYKIVYRGISCDDIKSPI